MLNVVNVSPVAAPALTARHDVRGHAHSPAHGHAHAQSAKPCLVLRALTRLVCGHCFAGFFLIFFIFIPLCTFLYSPSFGREMADGSSPRCDLIITNLHNQPPQRGAEVRVTPGAGPGRHYHQVDVPCPGGKVPRFCMKRR